MESVDIRPRVSGYLQSIGFKDGGIVKSGQILFVIDPRPYQATLDQAKGRQAHAMAALADAQTQLARGKVLLAARAISASRSMTASKPPTLGPRADPLAARAAVRAAADLYPNVTPGGSVGSAAGTVGGLFKSSNVACGVGASFLDLLRPQAAAIAADQALAASDRSLSADQVAVFQALGGGWEDAPPVTPPAIGKR